jgi:hypothetical protein
MNKRNMSLAALQIMIPYLNLIHPEDIDYIMGNEGRLVWYEKLLDRPIRTADNRAGQQGESISPILPKYKPGLIHRILRKLDAMIPIQY